MVLWPDLGTRVTVRYRRPAGSVPPLTDAVGHLLAIDPVVRVRTKAGAVVEFAPADAVALRVLPDTPVRTSQIRSLEHAAATAWPAVDHAWLDGWLLRAGRGAGFEANSAVPLDVSADASTIPAIADWYTRRGLPPLLLIPDRLLRPPSDLVPESMHRMLVCDLRGPGGSLERHAGVQVNDERHASVSFGAEAGVAATRAAVTDAPDGTRWVGLSADDQCSERVCEALLAWGASRGATRGYLRVTGRNALAESLGFRLHHHSRCFRLPVSL
ncbi:GCN5 family acetyltransferase [Mycobacterium sp. 1164966.3]|uniref:GNAT family N-acetyltransferase, cg3035/Rv0428c family n=1 Tax=Mycobacterium sp. 1164966.3 TaxID=1856861 RepID=UPI0008000DB5|nr:GCN5 family acetyltransferase [Mycobacterium sp. 1164966.3]OBA80477.1 GCN5 family acetyltransferase [Mycobacterium sp. 1164966.3]